MDPAAAAPYPLVPIMPYGPKGGKQGAAGQAAAPEQAKVFPRVFPLRGMGKIVRKWSMFPIEIIPAPGPRLAIALLAILAALPFQGRAAPCAFEPQGQGHVTE